MEVEDERCVRGTIASEGDLACAIVNDGRLNFRQQEILNASRV
jgi:hypothetical protein